MFALTPNERQNECNAFCEKKIVGNEDKAKVTPETYDDNGNQCCKCNYEKINTGGGEDLTVPTAVESNPAPEVIPEPFVPVLDPASFQPPSQADMAQATNPMYAPPVGPGKKLNFAVIQIRGMPWQLPLNLQQIEAFVYAMNNVTGVPWQYKGAAPAVPNQVPFPPKGIPTLSDDNAPTAPAPPPPVPSPPPLVPSPVVPAVDPAAIPAVDSAAIPAVDPAVTVDPAVAVVDPAVPGQEMGAASRRLRSDKGLTGRKLLQQQDEYSKDYNEPSYDYDYDPYNIKYGPSPDPYGQPSPDPYAQPSPDPYAQPSPDPYAQPSPDPYAQPSPDPYAQPSPDPYQVVVPSPILPPPPPPIPPPPPPSPPPPPPTVILPPNTNGIWYFGTSSVAMSCTNEQSYLLSVFPLCSTIPIG